MCLTGNGEVPHPECTLFIQGVVVHISFVGKCVFYRELMEDSLCWDWAAFFGIFGGLYI